MREWVICTGLLLCAAVAASVVHTYVIWRRTQHLGARDE